jgi:hypothetical protein
VLQSTAATTRRRTAFPRVIVVVFDSCSIRGDSISVCAHAGKRKISGRRGFGTSSSCYVSRLIDNKNDLFLKFEPIPVIIRMSRVVATFISGHLCQAAVKLY